MTDYPNDPLLVPPSQKSRTSMGAIWLFLGALIVSGGFWIATQQDMGARFFKPAVYEFSADPARAQETVSPLPKPEIFVGEVSSSEAVIETIENKVNGLQGKYGFYVKQLTGKETFGSNQNFIFTAASVNKVPIMVRFLLDVEGKREDLAAIYSLANGDKEEGTGSLQYQEAGKPYTFEELILKIGRESDNTAVNALVKRVSRDRIQSWLDQQGYQNTSILKNTTTPKEMGQLFANIYMEKTFKLDKTRDLFLKSLSETEFEDRITTGVPKGTLVYHKIGNQIQVWNDCGIVEAKEPYVLCILTDGIREAEAQAVLPWISQVVWRYLGD